MARVRLYWPVGLSIVCLVVASYFAATDTAYLVRGCRVEDYPEAFFIFVVVPAALLAFVLGLRGVRSGPPQRNFAVIASVVLSITCITATVGILAEPGRTGCRPASRIMSADDVQKDVDTMNANLRRSEREFQQSMNRPGPSDPQIASFQAEADKACLCTDRSGDNDHDRCWARYQAMTKAFQPEQLTSACLYRTTVVDAFPGNKWVSLNQCTADHEAAKLAKETGGRLEDDC